MNPIETWKQGDLTAELFIDDDPPNPRTEWDQFGTMVCWHRRYRLGDKHDYASPADFIIPRGSVSLALYLYDHSGITMRCEPFSCPWDSGQVGWIYADPATIRKEYGCKRITATIRAKALACLRSAVETYDQYLTGDVYGYRIVDGAGTHYDSCWGFYGREYAESEAQAALAREYAALAYNYVI